jgi:hypothetical protein
MDPDTAPGGPKTKVSGSATLVGRRELIILKVAYITAERFSEEVPGLFRICLSSSCYFFHFLKISFYNVPAVQYLWRGICFLLNRLNMNFLKHKLSE